MIDDIKHLTAFPSAARAEATYNGDDLNSNGKRGLVMTVDITAESGTATLDAKLQRKDRVSGKYTDIPGAAIAQQSATGKTELVLYPGATVAANLSISTVLTELFRVVVTVGGTTVTMTFSIGIALIP
jgi:hypothetical protein